VVKIATFAKPENVMGDVFCFDHSGVNLRPPLSLVAKMQAFCPLKNRWANARSSRFVFERLESIFQLAHEYSMPTCGF
jgi:hypothetical protein